MVHDNENVVLSLKIDEKIWPTQKSSDQHSKKKTSREEAETD